MTSGEIAKKAGVSQKAVRLYDEKGLLKYTSLADQLKMGEKVNIWNIHELGNRIYFQADNAVYYLENGKLGKIACKTGVNYSAVIYNKLYVAMSDGVYVLYGNVFKKDNNVSLPANANVVFTSMTLTIVLNGNHQRMPSSDKTNSLVLL